MKKCIALILALALIVICAAALAESEVPAFLSKTVQDRVLVEAKGAVVVTKENPEALVIASKLAVLPEDKKMEVFPEAIRIAVEKAIPVIPEVETIAQLMPVDTYQLEIADLQPGATLKLDDVYGDIVKVVGYVVEFLPETLAIEPLFVLKGEEIEIPEGVIDITVYTIAEK